METMPPKNLSLIGAVRYVLVAGMATAYLVIAAVQATRGNYNLALLDFVIAGALGLVLEFGIKRSRAPRAMR